LWKILLSNMLRPETFGMTLVCCQTYNYRGIRQSTVSASGSRFLSLLETFILLWLFKKLSRLNSRLCNALSVFVDVGRALQHL